MGRLYLCFEALASFSNCQNFSKLQCYALVLVLCCCSLLHLYAQPMPREGREVEGPIEANKPKEKLRQTPYTMPAGFEWADLQVDDGAELKELYDLLANNYVEDDDALFRFDYSEEFLKWALTPPGFRNDFLLAVRAVKSRKLVAFISAVPATVRVRTNDPVDMVEINFLCVHKKLRAKRLAPVLIKEITRRANMAGVFQAVYTAGVVLPVPVASARYHHRSLNPKKLVSVGFSRLAPRMTLARLAKLYKLPAETSTVGLRVMEARDVPGVHALLTQYLEKFQLCVMLSEADVAHWLLPRDGVIDSYVVASAEGKVTDLCSFYHLPSTILGRDDTLRAAYSYYNVANSVSWIDLMRDCLTLAKQKGADVFNALNLMENDEFLKELKFGLGDGNLQYYIYNWGCPTMKSEEIGIVLL
jgi:glycylpeptide N-tetradecanoyltransferase